LLALTGLSKKKKKNSDQISLRLSFWTLSLTSYNGKIFQMKLDNKASNGLAIREKRRRKATKTSPSFHFLFFTRER
jgi:hypothetical protein